MQYDPTKKEWSPIFANQKTAYGLLQCGALTNTPAFKKDADLNFVVINDTSGLNLSDSIKCRLAKGYAAQAIAEWRLMLIISMGISFSDIGLMD